MQSRTIASWSVEAFLDALSELPQRYWLAVGRSLLQDRESWASRQLACDALRAVLRDDELCLGAWGVCDALETCAFLATRSTKHWSCRDRRNIATACRAAEWAALALLAHRHLAPVYVSTLYEPFAQCFLSSRGALRSA